MIDINMFTCEGNLSSDAVIQKNEDGEIKIIFLGVCTTVIENGRKLSDRHSVVIKGKYLDYVKSDGMVGFLKKGARVRVEGIIHNRFRSPTIPFPSSEIYAQRITFQEREEPVML
jgi:single-stranded DNA-binding protein